MEVYEFDKCLLDRLEESLAVLSWKDEIIAASQVKNEWCYYIELQIEPAGWQALWKIPRVICEELKLRFPTVVFGYVEQVMFKELKAVFLVQAVQDDDVHLPERHEVDLQDLYPTLSQENTELNVERTADCLDRLRFFYTHVWMPWDYDNDDDSNWVEKHLESRIRFCYDLRKHSMKRALAAHIRTLIMEARYIQQRREYLEMDLSDDEQLNEILDKSQITDLMRLHLRLAMIRSEIEVLENPEMRHIYEEVMFDDEEKAMKAVSLAKDGAGDAAECHNMTYIVSLANSLDKQIQLLSLAQKFIKPHMKIQLANSLQDVLATCQSSDHIYLSAGRHPIKFLEYLNNNGKIQGLIAADEQQTQAATIVSHDDDSILLVFDGDFTLENIFLDCQNIRTGILIKNGNVLLKNCRLLGDGKSSTQQGIMCCGKSKLSLENCIIEQFSTGITMKENTSLYMLNSELRKCPIALDLNPKISNLIIKSSSITEASKCAVFVEGMCIKNTNAHSLRLKSFEELQQ